MIFKKKAKLLFLLMCTVMFFAMSCGSDDETESKNPLSDENITAEDTDINIETAEETALKANVPDNKYDGRTFTLFVHEFSRFDIDPEQEAETGEIVNDARLLRNRYIEEIYDVQLKWVIDHGWNDTFNTSARSAILAGDDSYDVIIPIQTHAVPMIYEGMFMEWGDLPYIDLSRPYWDKNVIRDLSFGNKIYMMAGDLNYSSYCMISVLLFNKNKFKDLNIEFPYDKVLDGTWTIDAMNEIIRGSYADLNGDGTANWADDRFGLGGWMWEMPNNLFFAMGGRVVEKDGDNMPVLAASTERSIDVMNKVYNLLVGNEDTMHSNKDWGVDMNAFQEGRLLMLDTRFISLNDFRNMQDDFGIIPAPKLDTYQSEYMPLVSITGSLTCVPMTNTDLEFTSIMLELLACESYNRVTPAFFNTTLQIKVSRDEESAKMLDIIMRQHSFAFYPSNMMHLATSFVESTGDYISFVERLENVGHQRLNTIIEFYE